MRQLVVDNALSNQLSASAQRLELRDPTGRLLGHFVPALDQTEPTVSEEELDRREKAGGGRPLADILVDLERRA